MTTGVFRSIPHALKYTREPARCALVELTLKAFIIGVMYVGSSLIESHHALTFPCDSA